MFVRGSTPTHKFTLPFDPPNGTEYRIIYSQGEDYKENILFEHVTTDCTTDGRVVTTRLTAKETLLFDCSPHRLSNGQVAPYPVKIQLGVRTPGEDILWSRIIETTVDRCLREDGVV